MRDLQVTKARHVPSGAQLVGGSHDGTKIERVDFAAAFTAEAPAKVILNLACGCEIHVAPTEDVAWIPPEGFAV